MKTTVVYVLRHAQPADGQMPNRARPLSELGRRQAETLVPYLTDLGIGVVYSSPFRRALQTVEPFCMARGISIVEREGLRESAAEERFPQVRRRMVEAVHSVVDDRFGETILIARTKLRQTLFFGLWRIRRPLEDDPRSCLQSHLQERKYASQ